MQHRTDGDDPIDRERSLCRAGADPEREITAQRVADDCEPRRPVARANCRNRLDDLVDAARMEQLLGETVRAAVIAEIQAKRREAGARQPGRDAQ